MSKRHYRELTVQGKVYQYNIGRSVIKIKGFGKQLFSKDDIGYVLDEVRTIVTPGMLAKFIEDVNKYPQKYPNLGKIWPEV